jgi:hypothetical protein
MAEGKKDLAHQLAAKSGNAPWLAAALTLSGSELNTLLLGVFRDKAKQLLPADILHQFDQNRFTVPSAVDTVALKELELAWLRAAAGRGFEPVTLSPLTPLGTCSVFGTVDQNKVVSAVRGAEVVSDATNVLALLIAQRYKKTKSESLMKYAVTHRHVRGQAFSNPAFSAHFGIFCLVTGGVDTGSFSFEGATLEEHLVAHLTLLSAEFGASRLSTHIYLRDMSGLAPRLNDLVKRLNESGRVDLQEASPAGGYYAGLQFKIFLEQGKELINLVDGGTVDWTQHLTGNRKHRALISGSGIELVHKIRQGMI